MYKVFEKGDIVTLKSGSPKMTINGFITIGDKRIAKCIWFESSVLHKEELSVDSLNEVVIGK